MSGTNYFITPYYYETSTPSCPPFAEMPFLYSKPSFLMIRLPLAWLILISLLLLRLSIFTFTASRDEPFDISAMKVGHFSVDDIEPRVSHVHAGGAHPRVKIPDVDIAIVGAGMAGLYVACRLLDQDPSRKIVILDKLDRTGGRLDSDIVTAMDGSQIKEEQGAMRFNFNHMDNLMSLLVMFDLVHDVIPFPMSSDGNNRNYFRGSSFTNAEAAFDNFKKWSELYTLTNIHEQHVNPFDVIENVFQTIVTSSENGYGEVPTLDKRTPEFWQDFRLIYRWDGILLKDWSLWNLLSSMNSSTELINLLSRRFNENGSFWSNNNAGVAIQMLNDFSSDAHFNTLEHGYSTLPNAMVKRIGMERIWLNTFVESIDRDEGNRLRVSGIRKMAKENSSPVSFTAEHVVLAVPRVAVEKLFVTSSLFRSMEEHKRKKVWNSVLSTTNQPLVKINLYYEKAWWGCTKNAPVSFGPSNSDLPLGEVDPFYEISDELSAAMEYKSHCKETGKACAPEMKTKADTIITSMYDKPAALTIYADYLNVEFWSALQGIGPMFNSSLQRRNSGKMMPASMKVVEESRKFLKLLFATENVPQPILTSVRIWTDTNKFVVPPEQHMGYGIHQWALHAQDDEIMQTLAKPIDNTNLYICGEAYSDQQGWVEGALRSADLVLEKHPFKMQSIAKEHEANHAIPPSLHIKQLYAASSHKRVRKYIDPTFPDG